MKYYLEADIVIKRRTGKYDEEIADGFNLSTGYYDEDYLAEFILNMAEDVKDMIIGHYASKGWEKKGEDR